MYRAGVGVCGFRARVDDRLAVFNSTLRATTSVDEFQQLLRLSPSVQLIDGDENGATPLMRLVRLDNFAVAHHLLSTHGGVLAAMCDNRGETAAHYAVRYLMDERCELFLQLLYAFGAQLNAQSWQRRETPLALAELFSHTRSVRLLRALPAPKWHEVLAESAEPVDCVVIDDE